MITANGLVRAFDMEDNSQPLTPEVVDNVSGRPVQVKPFVEFQDYDYIREELVNMIENTKLALENAVTVQSADPSPKNSEAVSVLTDSLTRLLSELARLNKVKFDAEYKNANLKPDRNEDGEKTVTHNNLIVISTADLISQIIDKQRSLK